MIPPQDWQDPAFYQSFVERVLVPGWHLVATDRDVREPGTWTTTTLLPGSLDEPVLITNHDGQLRGFSNVCTHRLATLAAGSGRGRLACPYHGRRFDLSGRCLGQRHAGPLDAADDLVSIGLARWNGLLFASLRPDRPFAEVAGPLTALLDVLDLAAGRVEPGPDYLVDGPAVAWIENYLEGLHLPWVHPRLNAVVDAATYRVQPLAHGCSLQVGAVGAGEPAFDLPPAHPHADLRVGGLYGWLFPLTALNLYPWGVSINLVQPLGPARTRIRYLRVVVDETLVDEGAGAGLDGVEAEDQAIVARVCTGMRSRLARPARPVPGHEDGVVGWHDEVGRLTRVTLCPRP